MDLNVTKDSKRLICEMYYKYLERRDCGISRAESKDFGCDQTLLQILELDWSVDDLNDCCRELERIGMLKCMWTSVLYHVWLTDSAVAYMENRFVNGAKDVAEIIGHLVGLIPGK